MLFVFIFFVKAGLEWLNEQKKNSGRSNMKLYVFQVNNGSTLTFDTDLAVQT